MKAVEESALTQLRRLLGVWYTDSPTWPPMPGIERALQLAKRAEEEQLQAVADNLRFIKWASQLDTAQRMLVSFSDAVQALEAIADGTDDPRGLATACAAKARSEGWPFLA